MSKSCGWVDVLNNTPEGIVSGERAGGLALVMDDKLPFNGIHTPERRAALETLGFQFGAEIGGKSTDDGLSMYIECKLPEGWRKGADPNDYYGRGSYLFDSQGRKRALMFTKETSYDRYASITLLRRYGTKDIYVNAEGQEVEFSSATHVQVVFIDCDIPFKVSGTVSCKDYQAKEALHEAAHKELLAVYPDADNPFAYWI